MTAKYERDGLTFQYPENWQLDEDPLQGFPRSISVTAKSGAFWCATVYDQGTAIDELTKQYVRTLEQEYEDLEQEPLELELAEETVCGLDLQFYCLDFLVRSRVFGLAVGERVVLLEWQAEDREFDQMEPVFRAISFSLLQP